MVFNQYLNSGLTSKKNILKRHIYTTEADIDLMSASITIQFDFFVHLSFCKKCTFRFADYMCGRL